MGGREVVGGKKLVGKGRRKGVSMGIYRWEEACRDMVEEKRTAIGKW